MKFETWMRACAALAAVLSVAGGAALYQKPRDTKTIEQKITQEIASNREAIDRLSQQLLLHSPADYGHNRIDARIFMINSQLAQAPDPVVILGDSITEAALFPSKICGHLVVNAGIGGLTPNTYVALISSRGLLERMRAILVVVALGTNNAHTITPLNKFEAAYRSLIAKLKPKADKIILAKVPAIRPGALAYYFDADRIEPINATIKTLADEFNLGLVDSDDLETIDGVHLSANGYKVWLQAIERSVQDKLGCAPTAEAH
jgi:lysophospholipase L1-like esterase